MGVSYFADLLSCLQLLSIIDRLWNEESDSMRRPGSWIQVEVDSKILCHEAVTRVDEILAKDDEGVQIQAHSLADDGSFGDCGIIIRSPHNAMGSTPNNDAGPGAEGNEDRHRRNQSRLRQLAVPGR